VRRYGIPYIGGFVCCDCGVLLCVGMGYCILGGLCFVTVVCCCASVWDTVYGGLCVVCVLCCCAIAVSP